MFSLFDLNDYYETLQTVWVVENYKVFKKKYVFGKPLSVKMTGKTRNKKFVLFCFERTMNIFIIFLSKIKAKFVLGKSKQARKDWRKQNSKKISA